MKKSNTTPLFFAARSSASPSIVDMLLNKGANVNAITGSCKNLVFWNMNYNKNGVDKVAKIFESYMRNGLDLSKLSVKELNDM